MGLRFRKSISIIPGLRLNFGKTGMSVSAGVPGFRKTIHTSGRVTTSVGIPGTGIYYVDTKNTNKPQVTRNSSYEQVNYQNNYQPNYDAVYEEIEPEIENNNNSNNSLNFTQLNEASLKSIHKTSDDSIDWTEVLVSNTPPDESYNKEMWAYYHEIAPKILSGDIDSYLKLIYEVNPLDDLLNYGNGFEFGTDDSKKIEVEFIIDETSLVNVKSNMNEKEYKDFFEDYVASVSIRVARDMFALLPVRNVVSHAVFKNQNILSVDFDRSTLSKIKFGYIDPSNAINKFKIL